MSMIQMIQTYMNYNDAMTRRIWGSIRMISDHQFVNRFDYSHGSIRDIVVHMAVVDGRWLRGLKEEPEARSYTADAAIYHTIQSAYEFWNASANQLMDYVKSLDESKLSETPIGMYGPVWHVLLHLVNHGTDHRAQILWALHELEAPTFDQDFILFEWFKQ
jgi:uncharacterized damage-inducible protein DinB